MRLLLSGSSGLVGTALAAALDRYTVVPLVRRAPGKGEVGWDNLGGGALEGIDAVVHLSGESIVQGRWTDAKKQRIVSSRVDTTRRLAEALAKAVTKPRVLVCASAIGFYGDRGDEVLTEDSAAGTGFLAEVCQRWERAAAPAAEAGIRTVHVRIGLALSAAGGAIKKMYLPFKLGLGGPIGSGRQFVSWITVDDLVAGIKHLMDQSNLSGPVNLVTAAPVRNREFARALGKAMHRPAVLPLPGFAARLALGEMADALLMSSARVVPKRLEADGFVFKHAQIDEALAAVLRP